MKIIALSENLACAPELLTEHGLSLYIETENHKIISDFGGGENFLKNAEVLGVDLSGVDIGFLSHGHHDHGDGLPYFFKINTKAPVYMEKNALEPHYALRAEAENEFIGVADQTLLENPRVRRVSGTLRLDEELTVFSEITGRELVSETNGVLMAMSGKTLVPDDFTHEQNLAITLPNGDMVLIAGCAHNGIANIMARFVEIFGKAPILAISGFHLTSPGGAEGYSAVTKELGRRLLQYPTKFYTCHCTGLPAYHVLKDIMGDRLDYISTGTEITI